MYVKVETLDSRGVDIPVMFMSPNVISKMIPILLLHHYMP